MRAVEDRQRRLGDDLQPAGDAHAGGDLGDLRGLERADAGRVAAATATSKFVRW